LLHCIEASDAEGGRGVNRDAEGGNDSGNGSIDGAGEAAMAATLMVMMP
jgi:hypothetical protein